MIRTSLIVLLVVGVLLAACQTTPKPDTVVLSAMQGWNAEGVGTAQIDTTLSYFSDNAVFKIVGFPPQIPAEFTGKQAIRAAYESWMPLHPRLQVDVLKVDGNTVTAKTQYWSDAVRGMGIAPLVGTDVYVVETGKIVSETWTLEPGSKAAFAAAFASAQPAPTPPAPSLGDFPTGTFTSDSGGWTWDFKPDGRYVSRNDAGVAERGTFVVNGSQVSFKGDYCGDVMGTYAWSYDGTTLAFTAVDDKCLDRQDPVVGNKWVKKQ